MSLLTPAKAAARGLLTQLGFRVQRIAPQEKRYRQGYDDRTPLPAGADHDLRPDNPRLRELEERYARVESPINSHTQWRPALRSTDNDLRYFRGENVYLWQYATHGGGTPAAEHMRFRYYVYARYIRELDRLGLLGAKLTEDGAFGCFAFRYSEMPTVSRDLLDSINELYFLDRHWGLFSRQTVRVLDIGAGYGRLAHRMLTATPAASRYACVDAIPRSTFLSEYYLRHRGLLGTADARAQIIALDELDSVAPGSIDLAINVHSFSEMSHAAVEAWLDWLTRIDVPSLMVVPNEPKMLSHERDGSRRGYRDAIESAGYRLTVTEPTILDADVRDLYGACDRFFLFERR